MKVSTFEPSVRVTLYKTIKRTAIAGGVPVSDRFRGVNARIDLTPFLGEGSRVSTMKSTRQAAGAFTVVLADKPSASGPSAESIYGLVEPMDMIEIRMTREPIATGAAPTLVMRGFVSTLRRSESMSPDGKPSRGVVIEGQDYGKLWQMLQILYLPGYVVGQDTITGYKLFERFGVGFETTFPVTKFVSQTLEKIVNPYIARLMPENTPFPKSITAEVDTRGTTSITGPQNKEGAIYDLLRTYSDVGIWNELFIEDREDGVYCVLRPNPFKSVDGKAIQAGPMPKTVTVAASNVVSLDVARTDANVANYYWTRSQTFDVNNELFRRQHAVKDDRESVLLGSYPNSSEDLYGIRLMMTDSQTGPDGATTFNSGQPEEQMKASQADQGDWLDARRRIVVAQNKDNVVFESGNARIRGDANIKAGCYVKFERGQFASEYYVPQVTQEYIPYQGFFTSLVLERGTGFIERAKRAAGSPYYAELA